MRSGIGGHGAGRDATAVAGDDPGTNATSLAQARWRRQRSRFLTVARHRLIGQEANFVDASLRRNVKGGAGAAQPAACENAAARCGLRRTDDSPRTILRACHPGSMLVIAGHTAEASLRALAAEPLATPRGAGQPYVVGIEPARGTRREGANGGVSCAGQAAVLLLDVENLGPEAKKKVRKGGDGLRRCCLCCHRRPAESASRQRSATRRSPVRSAEFLQH